MWGEAPAWLWVLINHSLPLRFATGFAYYSLAMGVEEFGVNLYVLQLIFGGVDVPAKFITMLSISYLGRHITEGIVLLLAGGCILALIFVPLGEKLGPPRNPLKEADSWSQCVCGPHQLGSGVPGVFDVLTLPLSHGVTSSRSLWSLELRFLV